MTVDETVLTQTAKLKAILKDPKYSLEKYNERFPMRTLCVTLLGIFIAATPTLCALTVMYLKVPPETLLSFFGIDPQHIALVGAIYVMINIIWVFVIAIIMGSYIESKQRTFMKKAKLRRDDQIALALHEHVNLDLINATRSDLQHDLSKPMAWLMEINDLMERIPEKLQPVT